MCPSFTSRRARIVRAALAAAALLGIASPATVAQQPTALPQCEPTGTLVRIPELPEASGLAASRRTPGRFWSHNDSREPVLFALDSTGTVTGRLRLSGATVEDWEAVGVGPCPAGSCIYVADIGDNDATRERITVYRVPEPAAATESVNVSGVFHATYPDGAHDAEALLVTPEGRLYIVTKGETGPVAIYRFPSEPPAGSTSRLERVGEPRESSSRGETNRITDGSVSPDGQWVVLRSTQTLMFYRPADVLAGQWRVTGRVALAPIGEPQGEGVTFGPDNSVYLIGEGGGKSRPGTFARLTCTLGP